MRGDPIAAAISSRLHSRCSASKRFSIASALARALAMLNLFDAEHREWSLDEMAAAIGSPRMTAYRSARTLQSAVYLVSDAVTGSHWLVWQCVPCLLYTSPSPRDGLLSRMPSSA